MTEIINISENNYRCNPLWVLENKLRKEHDFFGVIYLYVNTQNNKVYVGKTNAPHKRHKVHVRVSFNPHSADYTTVFHNAIRKYGIDCFKYYIVETVVAQNKQLLNKRLNELEIQYIKQYDATNKKRGYNVQSGGTVNKYGSCSKSRMVYQFSLDGQLISTHNSLTEAARSVSGVANVIKKACILENKAYGYRWLFTPNFKKNNGYTIYRYDSNGNYMRSFDNMTVAAKEVNISQSAISSAITKNSLCCQSYWRKYKTEKLPIEEFPDAVCQYDLNGNFITWYHNVNEAVKTINASGSSAICAAIKRYNAYHGFLWRREKHECIDPAENRYINKVAIVAIHPNGNKTIHATIKDAALDNHVSKGAVNRSIRNLPTHSTNNIKFIRQNEYCE